MKIILDGMGGDNAPEAIVQGAVLASREIEHQILIIGQEEKIRAELDNHRYDADKISVINATEILSNDEAPVRAVRSIWSNMAREVSLFLPVPQEPCWQEAFSYWEGYRGSTGLLWHQFIL